MSNQKEIWKDIRRFDGYYQASTIGRFRRTTKPITSVDGVTQVFKSRVLKLSKYTTGYVRVPISYNGIRQWCSAHRLIAETFIPNPENKPQVNHINNDKSDNRVENLEWVTQSENMRHAYDNGYCVAARGINNGLSKLTPGKVMCIREMLLLKFSMRNIGEIYAVSISTIQQIKQGKTWRHVKNESR